MNLVCENLIFSIVCIFPTSKIVFTNIMSLNVTRCIVLVSVYFSCSRRPTLFNQLIENMFLSYLLWVSMKPSNELWNKILVFWFLSNFGTFLKLMDLGSLNLPKRKCSRSKFKIWYIQYITLMLTFCLYNQTQLEKISLYSQNWHSLWFN